MKPLVGLVAVALALTGCSLGIGHEKVLDWPEMRIEVNKVDSHVVWKECTKVISPLVLPAACAVFYMAERRCVIWVAEGDDLGLEHEMLHCQGYDHIGATQMKNMLERSRKVGGG